MQSKYAKCLVMQPGDVVRVFYQVLVPIIFVYATIYAYSCYLRNSTSNIGGDAIISSTSFKGPSSLRGQNGVMIMNNCTLCYGGGGGGVMVSVAADCRLFTAKCRCFYCVYNARVSFASLFRLCSCVCVL